MNEETKKQILPLLSQSRSLLRQVVRIANTDDGRSKHFVRAINRASDDIGYEARRIAS